ncbi:MAG TPA: ABC transporter permease [Chitinophagaceae bacterium]|nr:ABC transporter permease [Chitinophagaceae bacterium]
MFKNYFNTAIRNLLRYKGFAVINITSLTIGIMGCMVIGLFVWDEWQFDKSIQGGGNIYRLYDENKDNNNTSYGAPVPPAYTTFLQQHYPEVEATTRILMSGDKFLMEAGEKRNYEEKGWFVDSSFAQFFSLKFLKGDLATALATPHAVVISEEIAKRFFGNDDPIDKTIKINKDTFAVKGVLAKLPSHFHLDFRYLMPLSATGISKDRMERWTWHQFYSYVKLKPGANVLQLQDKFQAYMKKEIYPQMTQSGSTFLGFFQPLKNIHLHSADFVYDNAIRGNATYVKALTIIALFVLLIACFNFINLATARSFRRAKEIGVRKVVGADRKQLTFQFLGETILLSVLSIILATVATFIVVPVLNQFTGKSIEFSPFTNPVLGGLLLIAGIVVGVLAGIYPALVLSGFQPIKVLKSMKLTGSGTPWLRQALVVIQFSLSALLIVSAVIVYKQTNYLNNKDLGFNKDQILFFQVRDSLRSNPKMLETFKTELKRSPNVVSVTSGYGLPGDQYAGDGIKIPTKDGEKEYSANVFIGDYDYVKTLGLRIIAGRDFSREMATDEREAFIINETAVKELGYGTPEKAIGQPMSWNEWVPADTLHTVKKGKVIGVVQDYHYKSLHEKLATSVIQLYPQVAVKVAVKLKTANMKTTIAYINSIWTQFSPGYPLDYKFMDESYGAMYKSEEKLASLLWIFTMMAIFVGCMGLFGLAAFSAEQRTKEIGIRKVLGASVFNIMGLLSKRFVILILVASLIAFPVAWWAMNNWLRDFPYRITISWWMFAIAALAALVIALITVSFQSIKAAIANPVKSLRTE